MKPALASYLIAFHNCALQRALPPHIDAGRFCLQWLWARHGGPLQWANLVQGGG